MVKIKSLLNKFTYKNDFLLLKKNFNELISYEIEKLYSKTKIEKDHKIGLIDNLKELLGTSIVEGLIIIESLLKTKNIVGDVCEFGVAQGKTSKLIANVIKKSSKRIFLFDSFQGLPKPSIHDELIDDIFNLGKIEVYEGKMSHSKKKVKNELKKIKFPKNRIVINEGFFNKNSAENFKYPKKISFAYIDFDFYQPIIDVLKIIEKKLVKNSIIIVDDYDFFSSGVKKAVDEWLRDKKKFFKITKYKNKNASFIKILKNV